MAEKVGREISRSSTLYYPHDKIIFLLAHRHDGAFEGKTCLAKALCILDALIFKKRDYIVIDYFGPEDANFPRAIRFLSAEKCLHIQRINSREHVLLTWRGYDYFRKMGRTRLPALMEFIQELIELAYKVDESLINTVYHFLFHVKWGEKKVPLSAFLKREEVIYNSLVYNFYRNQLLLEKRGKAFGMYEKEKIEVDVNDLILPPFIERELDGEDMKDGQRLALPYLEATNLLIMLTGRCPTARDIAKVAFSRLSYHEKLEEASSEENEKEIHVAKKEAIIRGCSRHLEILCERGLLKRVKTRGEWTFMPTARTYSFGDCNYAYTLMNRDEAHSYLAKIKEYVELYRRLLDKLTVGGNSRITVTNSLT